MSLGVPCPRCGEVSSFGTNTRPTANGVRRRRECANCGHRFTTRETLEGTHIPAEAVAALEERLHNVNRAVRGDFDRTIGGEPE